VGHSRAVDNDRGEGKKRDQGSVPRIPKDGEGFLLAEEDGGKKERVTVQRQVET